MSNESMFDRLKKRIVREEKSQDTAAQTPVSQPADAETAQVTGETNKTESAAEKQKEQVSAMPKAAEIEDSDGVTAEAAQEETEEEEDPGNAKVTIWVSDDRMEAYIKALPPTKESGAHVTAEQIREEIKQVGLTFGVVENAVRTIARLHLYDKGFTVAKGVPAKNGVNGSIDELYPRASELKLEPNANGIVDYKNLGLIHDVAAGAPLCTLHPPTMSEDGSDVFGKVFKGVDGRPVSLSAGKNTVVSPDGTQLLAAVGGNVVFKNGQFCIEDTMRIMDNVDNAVGNIHFSGDVLIDGDVCEGYEVHSGKNVTVKGSVEGATIIAKGNITLAKGMNGMQKGRLEAGGDVNCRFLENSYVRAVGNITAESILNSDISSSGKVVVRGRRGVIVGGACSAQRGVEAKVVGAMSHVPTDISIGATPEMLQQYQDMTERSGKLALNLEMLHKDITYLEALAEKGKLTPERLEKMHEMQADRKEKQNEFDLLHIELQQTEETIENSKSGRLSAMELYPPVKISIAKASITVQTTERNCAYYYHEGDIKRGTVV